ncbi:hypothetical protein [Caenispirillum bisanense]|uniref:hypothetical protein n=1 Tax=Caenispirillum bisanense TaxID=414052 RepID=UPI0031E27C0C
MRGLVYGLVALGLMAAASGTAFGLSGFSRDGGRPVAPVLGADGAYSDLYQQVAAVPAEAPLPAETAVAAQAALTTLISQAGVPCARLDHALRGRDEHPAYTLVTALCDCADGRGRLVNVMLFQSGRAAALALGDVMVERTDAGDVRYYAF